MGIIHYLLKNVESYPDKTAIIFADSSLSYRDITEQTRRLSYALSDIGVRQGTHIGILLNNSIEFVITMLAVADLGATIVPMSSTTGSTAILTAISASNIDYMIGWHAALEDFLNRTKDKLPLSRQCFISVGREIDGCLSFKEMLKAIPETYELGKRLIDDETDFILTMTSGSTSDPKPIVFTQGTKIRRILGAQELYGITEDDITLVATPLYHSISQRLALIPIISGGTSVIMQKFTTKNWYAQVDRHKVTFCIAVSSQLEMILRERRDTEADISTLRCLVCCCSLLKSDVKLHLIKEMECDFHECYGASEVGIVSNLSPETSLKKLHTVGKAVPGVEIKIVDDKRKPVAIGKIGEIACKSTMRFSRYYNNEQATRQSMEDSFFYTGDMGYVDEDGYLTFSGRKKEIIITGGTNVYPMDIEVVLNTHTKVKESAVVGVEDKKFGEAVVAFIISKEGEALSSRELQHYCLHRLADFQQPLAYVFVDDFPRTELGKVIKCKLADQCHGQDMTEELRNILETG